MLDQTAFAGLCAVLLAGACSPVAPPSATPSASENAAATTVHVTLTNSGCVPDRMSAPDGPVTFVTIDDAASIAELDVVSGEKVVGALNGLTTGAYRDLTVVLDAGDYVLRCPGAASSTASFEVIARAAAHSTGSGSQAASDGYMAYVNERADLLVSDAQRLATAAKAADIASAQRLYVTVRTDYDEIKPAAADFDDLLAAIEGTDEASASEDSAGSGLRAIEQSLWTGESLGDMDAVADQLVADVGALRDQLAVESLSPVEIAAGAEEQIDEIPATDVLGTTEPYSHLDLIDIQAKVDGAQAAFAFLVEPLGVVAPDLSASVSQRFADLQSSLAEYRLGPDAVSHDKLTPDDTRRITQAVDALAESLSRVAGTLADTAGDG